MFNSSISISIIVITDVLCAFCLSLYHLGLGLGVHNGKPEINTQDKNGFLFHIYRDCKLVIRKRSMIAELKDTRPFWLTAPPSLKFDS